jgi:murein DD-endopeptidase MepM/ murein hydrolase activator NlpD
MQQVQQSRQAELQSNQQLAEAYQQSTARISEAASIEASASAKASTQFAQDFSNFSQYVLKASEAAQKARLDQAKAAAVTSLENARIDWIEGGRIAKEGTGGYREAISTILGTHPLAPDDVATLTKEYFSPAVDYAKRAESDRQDTARKVVEQSGRITNAGLQAKLSASFAALTASTAMDSIVVERHYATVQETLKEFMEDTSVPLVDRITAAANAHEVANEIMLKRNSGNIRLQQQTRDYGHMVTYAATLQPQVLDGSLSVTDYESRLRLKALEMNLDGFTPPDPGADLAFTSRYLGLQNDITKLQEAKQEAALAGMPIDDAIIGSLATEFALNPATLAAVKATPKAKLDRNALAAIDLVDQFNSWKEKDVPQYHQKKARIASDMEEINGDFQKWFLRASATPASQRSPSETQLLEQLRIGGVSPELFAQPTLTPEQLEIVRAQTVRVLDAKRAEGTALDQEYANQQDKFAQVGLFISVDSMKEQNRIFQQRREQYQRELETIRSSQVALPQSQPGASPNFRGGALSKPTTGNIPRRLYAGREIQMPFQAEALPTLSEATSGQLYGSSRPGRTHKGLDFAIPLGTPTTSLVYGTITEVGTNVGTYGNTVEVTGDDGFIYYYAHLHAAKVQLGQRVGAGQVIGLVGDSGTPGAVHLHLEVAQGNKYNTIDPLAHLSSRSFGAPAKGVRTGHTGSTPQLIDRRAIPLGKDSYLLDGRIIKGGTSTPTSYSPAAPLRAGSVSNSPSMFDMDTSGESPYEALRKNPQLKTAIAVVAGNLKINPRWLADVIAYESAGTFSPSIRNAWGFTGLIQFGKAAAQDMGTTQEALSRMSAVQQMDYVEKYLRLQMRYAGIDQLRGPEELVAAINQGHTALSRVRRDGAKAINDPRNRDSAGVTLRYYMDNLGKYSGRKYRFRGDRASRLTEGVIHTAGRQGCTTCAALLSQSQFIPHEGTA